MSQAESAPEEDKLRSKGISLDILWVLVILSGFLFFTSLVPLPPNDFWWHLKIGEHIFINHAIPTTNMFAWTLPADQPFYYAAWLAEWLFYALFRLGGLALLTFFRTVLIGAAIWLIADETHRRSKSWRITALVIAIFSVMITNNLPVRTQMWAWLPFVTSYIILKRYTEQVISWRWLILCPIGMLVWVNVHGSYILGLVLIGAFFAGEVISKLLIHEESKTWQQIGWIGATGIASSLAVLVNPRFTGIINYTVDLLTDPPSQKLIEEWQSPSPHGLANIAFFVSILLFILLTTYSKYRLTPTEAILYGGFLWLAWSGQRYVIWYGMVATPILARLISSLPVKMPSFTPQKNWLNLILAILLFVPAIAVQPWFVERLPLPETYWQQVIRGSETGALISDRTPVSAAEYLNAHPGGKLFNEMGYGSYLIWAVPRQMIFVDPRVELYPYEQWLDYIRINNGTDYNNLLMQYGSDRILLDKNLQSELMRLLQDDPLWQLEYEDQYAQVFRKNSSP